MHGKGRDTDIHRADTQPGCGQRSDGTAAAEVSARDEGLHRHASLLCRDTEHGGGLAVGGVGLVGIGFEHGTFVDDGPVLWIMLVGKIRMHGVRIVGRDQQRLGEGAGLRLMIAY